MSADADLYSAENARLRALLQEAADMMALHWDPPTTGGRRFKADLIARIDRALSS